MKASTRAKWTERVRAWRASGQSAQAFSAGREFTGGALRWAERRLALESAETPPSPATAPLRAKRPSRPVASPPRFAPVQVRRAAGEVMVDVGGARLVVSRDSSLELLRDVVAVLRGDRA